MARCQSSLEINHPTGGFYRSTVPVSRDVVFIPFGSFSEPWLYPYWWVKSQEYMSSMALCLAPSRFSVNIWMDWISGQGLKAWNKPSFSPGDAPPCSPTSQHSKAMSTSDTSPHKALPCLDICKEGKCRQYWKKKWRLGLWLLLCWVQMNPGLKNMMEESNSPWRAKETLRYRQHDFRLHTLTSLPKLAISYPLASSCFTGLLQHRLLTVVQVHFQIWPRPIWPLARSWHNLGMSQFLPQLVSHKRHARTSKWPHRGLGSP